ncbi:MAG: tetratricopeptide repeat protein [Acidobacteria bacterium OLB17]|nr:MAG: tetratricopeptide repeat protein [Acidobacteria bacterium OLB17]MCZ2391826.1 tetratricopeptide repeat protein [Acidobacteriota bacterium]
MKAFHVVFILLFLVPAAAIFAQDGDEPDIAGMFRTAQDVHEKGDYEKAIELYKKILEAAPGLPEAEYQIGSAYLSLKKPAEAEEAFRAAVSSRPDWSLPLTALGDLLVRKYKTASATGAEAQAIRSKADDVLQKAVKLDADNIPAWIALADLRVASGASADVRGTTLAKLRELSDGKSNIPASLWIVRSILERSLNDTNAAKESLKRALQAAPEDRNALILLGESELRSGDVNAAAEIFRKLEPDGAADPAFILFRARLLSAQGKPEEALRTLSSLKTAESQKLADSLRVASSEDAPDLERRLKDDPSNAAILGRLCVINRISAPEKALEYCRRASEADPENIAHAIGYSGALIQARQFAQAAALAKKLVEFAPDNATVRTNLALAYFELKAYAQAREQYQWLVDHKQGLPVAYYFVAITQDHLGDYRNAVANYQLFLRNADPAAHKLQIDQVTLRLPAVEKLARGSK